MRSLTYETIDKMIGCVLIIGSSSGVPCISLKGLTISTRTFVSIHILKNLDGYFCFLQIKNFDDISHLESHWTDQTIV